MNEKLFILFVAILAITIILFMLFREIVLWYFAIKERIKLQKEQIFLLRKIAMQLGAKNEELEFKEEEKKEMKTENKSQVSNNRDLF